MSSSAASVSVAASSVIVTAVEVTPIDPAVSTNQPEATAVLVIEQDTDVPPMRNARAPPRMRRSRKRTAAEQEEARAVRDSWKRHRHVKKYKDRMRNFRRNIVRDLQDNGGEMFLKDVRGSICEEGWDLDQYFDLDKMDAHPEAFFLAFSTYLGSLKHKKLKKGDGSAHSALHDTLKQTCTAVNNVWKAAHREIPFLYKSLVTELLGSKKKKEKKLRARGDIPDDNGRDEMSFELYRELALYFLKRGNLFAHLFLILCWNMMVRNCNCDDVIFTNCVWRGDCFGISVKRTKTNQDGSRDIQTDIKHIYANPLMPEVCPILAMAMYFLANPFIGHESSDIFPGKDTQVRFNNNIADALSDKQFQEHLRSRGIPFHNVGAYSTRKGSSTYCTSGTTCGPSIIAVCLRAGWAIGETLSRYLKKGDAGDQFCGRVVCGLPQLTKDFAMLPPHFKYVGDDDQALIASAMKMAFPYSDQWGASFEPTVIYMLASLVHHQDWIKDTLPLGNPVRQKGLMVGNTLVRLQECLAQEGETTIQATGVPVWCKLFININAIQKMVDEVREELRKLPDEIKGSIREAFLERDTSSGTASVEVMNRILDEKLERFATSIKDAVSVGGTVPTVTRTAVAASATQSNSNEQQLGVWVWHHESGANKYTEDRGRFLPRDFRLSYDLLSKRRAVEVDVEGVDVTRKKITACDAWAWWWQGMPYGNKRIRPLKELQQDPKFHFFHDNARRRYNDIKGMCVGMVKLIEETGSIIDVSSETVSVKMMLFVQGWRLMCNSIRKYHPNDSWTNKTYKETVACTTLKKHFYAAMAEQQHLLRLTNLVVHLQEDLGGVFLKAATDVSRNWTHDKMLDAQVISNELQDFVDIFAEYLNDYSQKDTKNYLKSVESIWPAGASVHYKRLIRAAVSL